MKFSKWLRNQFKKKARIYILPTRMGGYFNGLIFLMFLLAVGYNNNLLLIFTLFLFALNLMWVIQTHFHLLALKMKTITINEGHAGEELLAVIHWLKTPKGPSEWQLSLENSHQILPLKVLENSNSQCICQVTLQSRGLWNFQHLFVKTELPFGLYKVWVFLPVVTSVHVFPRRLPSAPSPPVSSSEREGEFSTQRIGPHDVRNLAPYDGSESRKISWKHYARSGELVVKEGEELRMSEIKFAVPVGVISENFLSLMATQMVFCQGQNAVFSLETPLKKIGPGSGEKHLHDCLRVLSLC